MTTCRLPPSGTRGKHVAACKHSPRRPTLFPQVASQWHKGKPADAVTAVERNQAKQLCYGLMYAIPLITLMTLMTLMTMMTLITRPGQAALLRPHVRRQSGALPRMQALTTALHVPTGMGWASRCSRAPSG